MATRKLFLIVGVCSIIFLTGFIGCLGTSKPVNYYVMTPIEDAGPEAGTPQGDRGPAIGVGPVKMPLYLDRQQIITRNTPNQIETAEFHQWAEPLKNNIVRVLAENLSILLDSQHVLMYPYSKQARVEFQVPISVMQFDAHPGRDIRLKARWAIIRETDKEMLMIKVSEFTVPYDTTGYPELAAGHSEALAELSREIAREVQRLYEQEH